MLFIFCVQRRTLSWKQIYMIVPYDVLSFATQPQLQGYTGVLS